jgi:hypothetical protein
MEGRENFAQPLSTSIDLVHVQKHLHGFSTAGQPAKKAEKFLKNLKKQ